MHVPPVHDERSEKVAVGFGTYRSLLLSLAAFDGSAPPVPCPLPSPRCPQAVLLVVASGYCITRSDLGPHRGHVVWVPSVVLVTGLVTDYIYFLVILGVSRPSEPRGPDLQVPACTARSPTQSTRLHGRQRRVPGYTAHGNVVECPPVPWPGAGKRVWRSTV